MYVRSSKSPNFWIATRVTVAIDTCKTTDMETQLKVTHSRIRSLKRTHKKFTRIYGCTHKARNKTRDVVLEKVKRRGSCRSFDHEDETDVRTEKDGGCWKLPGGGRGGSESKEWDGEETSVLGGGGVEWHCGVVRRNFLTQVFTDKELDVCYSSTR